MCWRTAGPSWGGLHVMRKHGRSGHNKGGWLGSWILRPGSRILLLTPALKAAVACLPFLLSCCPLQLGLTLSLMGCTYSSSALCQ